MEFRQPSGITRQVSLLGFGCMRFPKLSAGSEEIDREAAEKMVDFAYQNGVNYFDTAWIYHGGTSENFIGDALKKYPRDSFALADKLPNWLVKEPAHVDEYFDKQLKKCGVEYFDFYLVHALNKKGYVKMVKNDVYETLMRKKEQGLIKHLGFSYHENPMFIKTVVEGRQWDFAQIQLNYLDWIDINSRFMYNYLTKKGIPVVVMEPVRGGTLANLPPAAASVLTGFKPNLSQASWALRFAASNKNVMTVLSGMSDMTQVQDNIRTFSEFKPLSSAEKRVLNEALTEYRNSNIIKCTGCRYCVSCHAKVAIPEIFAAYNEFCLSGNSPRFAKAYEGFGENAVSACTECGACSSLCPQGLSIPELLKGVKKTLDKLDV